MFRALIVGAALLASSAMARDLSVTVLGKPDDPRVAAVGKAVEFWNNALAANGSELRLKVDKVAPNSVPTAFFIDPARAGRPPNTVPAEIADVPGDIVIALVDANFISFTLQYQGERRFIGLRSTKHALLDFPGVAENIAAHELGHALGLPHNDVPSTLMCGAPAPCRPDRFAEGKGAFFTLRDEDRALLGKAR